MATWTNTEQKEINLGQGTEVFFDIDDSKERLAAYSLQINSDGTFDDNSLFDASNPKGRENIYKALSIEFDKAQSITIGAHGCEQDLAVDSYDSTNRGIAIVNRVDATNSQGSHIMGTNFSIGGAWQPSDGAGASAGWVSIDKVCYANGDIKISFITQAYGLDCTDPGTNPPITAGYETVNITATKKADGTYTASAVLDTNNTGVANSYSHNIVIYQ